MTDIIIRLRLAAQRAESEFSEAANITRAQYHILLCLSEKQPLTQTAIVDASRIDRSTVAEVIRRMIKQGFIQRHRNRKDTRAYDVRLTDDGKELLRRVRPIAAKVDADLSSRIKNPSAFSASLTAIARAA